MTDDARVREIALLPCPFCGGDAKIGGIRDGARVYCNGCHASGAPAFNPDHIEGAQVKWNTRASAALPPQRMTEEWPNPETYKLPCDVHIPPRTFIRKGCTLAALLTGIKRREGLSDEQTRIAAPVHQSSTSDRDAALDGQLAEFARWAIREGAWAGLELDGGSIQDRAIKLGLIVETKYDPLLHGPNEFDVPVGGPWYVFAPGLLPSPPTSGASS